MKSRILFFIFCIAAPLMAHSHPSDSSIARPRIGLVLSGGGARGFAHIGTLKLLDSLDIPIDCIAGTSMGGIIGALYAAGYTGEELEKLVRETGWQDLFQDAPPRTLMPAFIKEEGDRYQLTFGMDGLMPKAMSGFIFGQKIQLTFLELLFAYESVHHFDDLPIPFRCVATDLITGNEVVLKSGSLAKAVRATMSIPSLFSPVRWGDSLLVDGGMLNNLPVNVVKEMGADIVIAVNVSDPLQERKNFDTVLEVLAQSIDLLGVEKLKRNLESTDILISPDLKEFNITDFLHDRVLRILARGETAAAEGAASCHALKKEYRLCREGHPFELGGEQGPAWIRHVTVTGAETLGASSVYSRIHIGRGNPYLPERIKEMLAVLRRDLPLESIRFSAIPVPGDSVDVQIQMREKKEPLLYGVEIRGNRFLPFDFIFNLLHFKKGYRVNPEDLSRRITELYALGYFNYITYTLDPVDSNSVRLILTVQEKPHRKYTLGVRYDDHHRLVVAIALKENQLFVPGLRWENEIQLLGLTRFNSRLYYSSIALNLPLYPFGDLSYKNIPVSLFDREGSQISEYIDKSLSMGAGIGLLPFKAMNIELGFFHEWLDMKPSIALSNPEIFPSWKGQLSQLRLSLRYDRLDSALLPRKGFLLKAEYETSPSWLGSPLNYELMDGSVDVYATVFRRHTFRFYGFRGTSTRLPVYKFFNQGRPETFVGTAYDQVFGSGMTLFRLDYRIEIKEFLFLSLMANVITDFEYVTQRNDFHGNDIWGVGVGIKIMSPAGPLEFIFSRRNGEFSGSKTGKNEPYSVFGTRF